MRVAVAGAGALGLACALALARSGARVRLYDPAAPGANASGVAAGMLAPVGEALTDASAAPHLPLLLAAREAWSGFAADHGLDLDRSGGWLLGDMARLADMAARAAELGLELEHRRAADLPVFPGGFSATVAGGLFTTQDWRIDARSVHDLLARCRDLGVEVVPQAFARGEADRIVLAGGLSASLRKHAPELAVLAPIRGHILVCEGVAHAGPVFRGPGAYAAPSGGGLLVGATMEPGEAQAEISPAIAGALAVQAARTFPGLGGWSWRARAGVRAAAPDGLPLVGPSSEGAILAAGARRNGWLLAPLVGRMVADILFERDPGPWAARLAPGRFAPERG